MINILDIFQYILAAFFLIFSLVNNYSHQSTEYTDLPPPTLEYSSSYSGHTPEEIQDKLVKQQEKFVGKINYKYTNKEKTMAEIHMFNDYTGDDSVLATDRIYTIKKDGQLWKIVSIKGRWECRSSFFERWSTSACS